MSDMAFSGGSSQYQALLQVAGPAKGKDIFWMPAFPTTPMKGGDTFSHTVSASGAGSRTEYELEEVRGVLAQFRLRYSGSTSVGSGTGTESGEGHAVFDMEKGMWRSHTLRVEGTVTLPGSISMSYKSTLTKEIASHGGCDRATTGVDNADGMINNARRLADNLLGNALTGWPGTGQDLYAVYRHFHCPTGPQISRIGDHLRRARGILGELQFICLAASADPCSRGGDAYISGSRLVQLCPSFFQYDDDHARAGILISGGTKISGVSESHLCRLSDACYYNFMEPAEDIITGNPFAYAYLVRELSGWTPTAQPDRVPCFPSLTDDVIRVRGGASATDPASVQNEEGDVYGIMEDLVTGDRFTRHDHLEGADHYLYQESLEGMRMRYYLPSGD
jgi:hypothetical protein